MTTTAATGSTDTTSTAAPPAASTVRGTWRRRLRRDWILVALMAPGILYFLVFHYGALFGNVIAFLDYVPFRGIFRSTWVGLANFQAMLADPAMWNAVSNTIQISVLQLVFYFPVPIALAMLLHSLTSRALRGVVQSVVYLPHFISWVIVVALFQQILGGAGVLNGFLADHGLHTVDIIGNPLAFKPLVVAQVIWKDCGWGTIMFLAALHQVDPSLQEAAAVDGANWRRRTWHVTLPALRPIIILLFILKLGEILSTGFEQIYLQRASVGPEAAEVLDTFVYFTGVGDGDWGFAAAAGLFKGVIGAILIYAANRVARRLGEQGIYG